MSRRYGAFFLGVGWMLACSDAKEATEADAHSGSRANHALDAGSDAGPQPQAADTAAAQTSADPFEPPPNSSFETARTIEANADTMQRVVNDAQVDYYSFEAKAGVFYVLSTDVSRFSPNNVLTVFDPERAAIAENDDGSLYPGDHIDARIVMRPEHSGTYYVTVEDRTAIGADEEGHFIPPPFYKLSLREISETTEGYALEEDDHSPTSLTLLEDAVTKTRYVTLLGDLSNEDSLDTFEIHGLPDKALIGQLLAAGDHGDSSTASSVAVRVTAGSDGHLLAACGSTSGQTNFHPPVDDASYKLEISADDHTGSNGFYAIDLVLLTDNPHEHADMDNNDIGAAEPIMFSTASSRRGLLLSRLPKDDIDYYSFNADAGELAAVHCEGESGGSGVRGLQADVLSPMMEQLTSAHEASTTPLAIEPIKLETSGTHYLKLSSKTPAASAEDVEPWVRCSVVIGH